MKTTSLLLRQSLSDLSARSRGRLSARLSLGLSCLLLAACTSFSSPQIASATYDLGPLPAASTTPIALPALAISNVAAPAYMDGPLMFYRLAYANGQQARPYANAQWLMAPAQLLEQRLKARIAAAGGVAVSTVDGATNVLVLRVEADDFMQVFNAPGQSSAQVTLRAAVFEGKKLIAQKSFSRQAAAASADSSGGARALASASDAVIGDILLWLSGLPVKK